MFCLRTLRELKLLKFLSEAGVSENVCIAFSFSQLFHQCSWFNQDYLHSRYHQATFARSIQRGLLYVPLVLDPRYLLNRFPTNSDSRVDGD